MTNNLKMYQALAESAYLRSSAEMRAEALAELYRIGTHYIPYYVTESSDIEDSSGRLAAIIVCCNADPIGSHHPQPMTDEIRETIARNLYNTRGLQIFIRMSKGCDHSPLGLKRL